MASVARYSLKLFSGRQGGLTRFTMFVAIIGIAAGAFGLVVAQSISRGLRTEIEKKILQTSPQIAVFLLDGTPISDENIRQSIAEINGITSVSGAIYDTAIVEPANARVVSLRVEDDLKNLKDGEILIGRQLAESLNKAPQEIIKIAAVDQDGEVKTDEVRIAEILTIGIFEYDSTWIKMSPATYQHLTLSDEFQPKVLNIKLSDAYLSSPISRQIKRLIGEKYQVVDWTEANRPLFSALDLERRAAFAVILLIIFIAMINIATTLSLVAREKRFDIAVLRVCGISRKMISTMIILNGIAITLVGSILGVVCGAVACLAANNTNIFALDPQVYFVSKIYLMPQISDALLIIALSIIAAIIVSLIPARRAASTKPAAVFRET